ncbi:MAG TPA: DUF2441 domain-containing protein [Prevotellaceae bacterium]|jgi:hypothetical protein|nr:DUF2441 domain-containing protein [Prevotellaceae bacterium]
MERKLYRILNNEETYDFHYTSYIYQSEWRCSAIEFYEQIEKACKLSQECNIKISSALRIATQYGWVIKDVQQMVRDGANEIPLDLFLVYNEQKKYIPMQPLMDFIVDYNKYFQETGIFLNEDNGHGQYFWEIIWDIVRKNEFPDAPCRLDCCFAFTNKKDAVLFANEFRDNDNRRLAEIIINDADVTEYDMQWLTNVPVNSTMNEAIEYARNYWKGLKTENPIIEALILGEYTFNKSDDE